MGQELVYCFKCGTRLKGAQFNEGSALRVGEKICCAACSVSLLDTLPPDQQAAVLKALTPPPVAERKTPAPARGSVTPMPRPRIETDRTPRAKKSKSPVLAFVIAGMILLGLVGVVAVSQKPTPASRPSASAGTEEPPDVPSDASPTDPAVPPPPARPAPAPVDPRSDKAKAAWEKAKAYVRDNPQDLLGQVRAIETALWDLEGTSYATEARESLAALKKRESEFLDAEFSALQREVAPLESEEKFEPALRTLDRARHRFATADWTKRIDARSIEIERKVQILFRSLKEQASAGAAPDPIRERIRQWGIPDLLSKFNEAFPESAPTPAPNPYAPRWEKAMALASDRFYAQAVAELEAAGTEAAADIEILRTVRGVIEGAVQELAQSSVGKKISVKWRDGTGAVKTAEGTLLRASSGRLELKRDKETITIELRDVLAESIVSHYRKQKGASALATAYFFILEGDPGSAKAALEGKTESISNRYWALNPSPSKRSAEASRKEHEARQSFYAAEKEFRNVQTRPGSVAKFQALLEGYPETDFVRRNRPEISRRAQGLLEYVFAVADMKEGGSFKRAAHSELGQCWQSNADVPLDRRNENFLDVEFYAKAGTPYRLWIYCGGCCAETLTFFFQGTEMAANSNGQQVLLAPGSPQCLSITPPPGLPANHAAHGGKKQPSQWGWTGLTISGFPTEGIKKLRLLTNQQGFSIGAVVISGAEFMQTAPTMDQLKYLIQNR